MLHGLDASLMYKAKEYPLIVASIVSLMGVGPNLVLAHTSDYNYGFKVGVQDGNGGIYDSGDACQNALAWGNITNSDHCDTGYHDGFYSVCKFTDQYGDCAQQKDSVDRNNKSS